MLFTLMLCADLEYSDCTILNHEVETMGDCLDMAEDVLRITSGGVLFCFETVDEYDENLSVIVIQ